MRATEELMAEHRAIERMLRVLEVAGERLAAGQPVRVEVLRDAVEFVRNFADECHHGKEEENLFPRLAERGVPREAGPLAVMMFEHDEGRAYVRAIAGALEDYESGDEAAAAIIAKNARGYVELLRGHIWKEENVLFPMADSMLSPEDQEEMAERFERIEREVMGPGVHERYHEMLDTLERELGLG